METERLIIDQIKETDKADYFINISHDKKVLETFICRHADTMEEFDFSSYPGRQDLFAIRLKETGRLIGIITYFDEKEDSCEIGYGTGSGHEAGRKHDRRLELLPVSGCRSRKEHEAYRRFTALYRRHSPARIPYR